MSQAHPSSPSTSSPSESPTPLSEQTPATSDAEAASPLEIIAPDAISALFNIDPEFLKDEDVDQIVKAYRAQRAAWAIEDAKPKAPRGQKKAEKARLAAQPKVPINTDDLLGSL